MYNKNEKIFDMKRILFLVLLLVATTGVYGQKFAVKSNLLYDATATINLGVEVGLAKKWSLDLSGNYNGWKLGDEAIVSNESTRMEKQVSTIFFLFIKSPSGIMKSNPKA